MNFEVFIEALNFIEFAGLSDAIEVRIGQCEELVEELILGSQIVKGSLTCGCFMMFLDLRLEMRAQTQTQKVSRFVKILVSYKTEPALENM